MSCLNFIFIGTGYSYLVSGFQNRVIGARCWRWQHVSGVNLTELSVFVSSKKGQEPPKAARLFSRYFRDPFPHPGAFHPEFLPPLFSPEQVFTVSGCSVFLLYSILLFSQVGYINYLSIFRFQSFSLHILLSKVPTSQRGLRTGRSPLGSNMGCTVLTTED